MPFGRVSKPRTSNLKRDGFEEDKESDDSDSDGDQANQKIKI